MEADALHKFYERPDPSLFVPDDHPIREVLDRLCAKGESFETDKKMEELGFEWSPHRSNIRYWDRSTFTHPELPEWEFRGSPWGDSPLSWYYYVTRTDCHVVKLRLEIARLAKERGWNRIDVPETWAYFPPWAKRKYALRLTKRQPLLSQEENERCYLEMREEVMRQILDLIATIEYPFEGPTSLPFCEDGNIALLLEGKPEGRIDGFAVRFLPHIGSDMAAKARLYWNELLRRKEEQWPTERLSETLRRRMEPFLLSTKSREGKILNEICTSPEIFVDRGALVDAGFELVGSSSRLHSFQIMVVRHPALPGYVIKSFPLLGDVKHPYRHLKGYIKRCENALRVRDFAEEHGLRFMSAVAKGIFPLPSRFETARAPDGKFLLIAEETEVMAKRKARKWQHELPIEVLEEMLLFYRHFGVSDSSWENHPVTVDGRVVWIDTEYIGDHPDKGELFNGFRRMIGDDRWDHALEYWERLK